MISSTLESALATILDSAIKAMRADFGNIQLCDAPDATLTIAVHQGFETPFLDFFKAVHDDAACGAAQKHRRRVIVEDVRRSRRFSDAARRTMVDAQAIACQSTPIVSRDGRIVGMISTHFRAPHTPTARQLKQVDILAAEASRLLDQAEPETGESSASRDVSVSKVRCPECRSILDVMETPSGARSVSVSYLGPSVEQHPQSLELFLGSHVGPEVMCPACSNRFDASEPYRVFPSRLQRSS